MLAALAVPLLLTSAAPGARAKATKVSVQLKWLNQSQFAGFYVAAKRGLYGAAGLDVTLEPGGPDAPSLQRIASGSATFGVAGADQILLAREQGVDLVAIAVDYRQTPFVLMTRKSSGITTMKQLAGKKVGVKFGQSEEVTYRAMAAAAGIKGVHEVPVKFDLGPFLNGSMDAFPGYAINEVLAAREAGVPVNVIGPASVGVHLYGDTLFTTGAMIRKHPDTVRAFVKATLAGWRWAAAHSAPAAALALQYDKTLKLAHERAMMKASLPYLKPDAKPIGFMDTAGWTALEKILLRFKQLKKPTDVSKAFTTAFLPAS
jgi:ABC-type nitrate/sulfonate/bicarbonate transport system substrate-binding protein